MSDPKTGANAAHTALQQEMFTTPAGADGGRGAGRPPGATNKRTRELVGLIATTYGGTPAEKIARFVFVDEKTELLERAKVLAKDLNCKPVEALRIILDLAKELLPYCHQKLPLAIEGVGAAPIVLAQNVAVWAGQGPSAGTAAGREILDARPLNMRASTPEKTTTYEVSDCEVGNEKSETDGEALK
jgi:hypothetical protein